MIAILSASPVDMLSCCSMCARDKKPKVPMLVISMSTATAALKYDLSSHGHVFQLRCSQETVTSLPTSSAPPIMTTGINAAANSVVRPMILK